ncbi:hypothetical protein MBLNU457_7689t1 [Dothideomycetes sp. NU457]
MLVNGYLVRDGSHFRITKKPRGEEVPHATPIVLEYLAEGNANVVYRVVLFELATSSGSLATTLILPTVENVVLRLSKQKNFIASTLQRSFELQKSFSFIPEKHLVRWETVVVSKDIIEGINRDLLDHERSGRRPASRRGDPVTLEDDMGLFLTDMTATATDTVLEFKPKWLSQSPNAPAESVRCRTCALRAQRQATKDRGQAVPSATTWCPLALVSGDQKERLLAAAAILKANKCHWISDGEVQLANLFANSDLLGLLKEYQKRLDSHGILESLSEGNNMHDLRTAMTLRDCTLFITSRNGRFDEETELKLADLDLKASLPETTAEYAEIEQRIKAQGCFTDNNENSIFHRLREGPQRRDGSSNPDSEIMVADFWSKAADPGKVAKWAAIERRLIDEGWYTNREFFWQAETICVLSHNKDVA